MKKRAMIGMLLVLAIEITVLAVFAVQPCGDLQDSVAVNEAVYAVQTNWGDLANHKNRTGLDYVVLDADNVLLFRTREGLSESINEAILHRDTLLDLTQGGAVAGKIIFYNDSAQHFKQQRQTTILLLLAAILIQCIVGVLYFTYLNRTIIKPFSQMKGFAERVAGGNLDIPLTMDRQNLFGAFTESFDIMRTELKRARAAEAAAITEKKELVAKLSHDIRTPVASIKAASEVGAALADSERLRDNYTQIIRKADQINTLMTNLFTSTLEELQQLPVLPVDMESQMLCGMLADADYMHRAAPPRIPDCLLYADKLRLQQVFDNIFANSYKYADTAIAVAVCRDGAFLTVSIEDSGGGVSAEELPHLKKKFWRGSNARQIEGAGLGLYISDYFMREMWGALDIENGAHGLRVYVRIALSGTFSEI